MFESPPVIGLVLAGGSSSRMGSDKAALIYHDRPQAQYAFDLITSYGIKTYHSLKGRCAETRYPTITDKYNFMGPLNGILSAMSTFPGFALLSIPCDMPSIDIKLISTLMKARNDQALAICFKYKKQIEPLFALWEPGAFEILQKRMTEGVTGPIHFFDSNSTVVLDSQTPLANINDKRDYKFFLNQK